MALLEKTGSADPGPKKSMPPLSRKKAGTPPCTRQHTATPGRSLFLVYERIFAKSFPARIDTSDAVSGIPAQCVSFRDCRCNKKGDDWVPWADLALATDLKKTPIRYSGQTWSRLWLFSGGIPWSFPMEQKKDTCC